MANTKTALKISLLCVFILQFIRLVCVVGSYYVIYTSLFIEGNEGAMFDESTETEIDVVAIFGISVPILETTMSITSMLIIIRFSRVGAGSWCKWAISTRIFWMRVLWDITAIVYASMYVHYRTEKEKISLEKVVNGTGIEIDEFPQKEQLAVSLIPVEYACLGFLEVVSRIFTGERIEQLANEMYKHIGGCWGKIFRVTYSLALVVYALRNFGVSLYFGMYSVILAEADKENKMKILMMVLQIYLAVMRGKFFQFFLRLFLLPLTKEEDSEDFKFPQRFIGTISDEEEQLNHVTNV